MKSIFKKHLMTYDEYQISNIKYPYSVKCMVSDCNELGLYEGGDARCHCPMCEKHVGMASMYRRYLCDGITELYLTNLTNEELYSMIKQKHERLKDKLHKTLEEN